MTPTGFINGQDESRCYVKLTFQVPFFNIFFRQFIINIDCEKIKQNMDNSEDDFRGYIQKCCDTVSHTTDFFIKCELLE